MSKSESMTDEELLEAIRKCWYEISAEEYDIAQERDYYTVADEYSLSNQEEYLDKLEKAYKARGLVLPDRWAYVSQFSDDEETQQEVFNNG